MYCLEKLQRELAYFFDMDLRELPRVQDLLAAKGYTQVQKGDEIIKLEPSAQAESTLESTTQISQEIKDIIDTSPAKGRDMQIIGEANFTPQVVEYAHKNSFVNPQEAKDLCDYVFQNAFIGLQASDKKQALIIAKLQDSNNDYGSVAFRVQNINGEHRIRSVMLMEQKQVDLKIQKAKELGEPIFHFW